MQPVMIPRNFRNQVSKPLMSQLMGIDVHVVAVFESNGIYDIAIGEDRTSGIFHPSIHEIHNRYLTVNLPGIWHPGFPFQDIEDPPAVPVSGFCFQAVGGIVVQYDGGAAGRLKRLLFVFPDSKCEQVTAHRLLHVKLPDLPTSLHGHQK